MLCWWFQLTETLYSYYLCPRHGASFLLLCVFVCGGRCGRTTHAARSTDRPNSYSMAWWWYSMVYESKEQTYVIMCIADMKKLLDVSYLSLYTHLLCECKLKYVHTGLLSRSICGVCEPVGIRIPQSELVVVVNEPTQDKVSHPAPWQLQSYNLVVVHFMLYQI
jgi:hypothetical protein